MATVTGAVALNLRTVRVTFSVALADATSLEIDNWTFECLGAAPFFVPEVASIIGVDSQTTPSAVDITMDSEFTPGLLYSVACSGVTGIGTFPDNTAYFYSQIPTQYAGRDFDLISFVPQINKREDTSGQLAAFISCLQEVLTLVLSDHDRWTDILDPDKAPENFVDAMLGDLGNAFDFITDLTLSQKRHLAKLLVPIYQLKGTVPGMVQAIRLLLGFESQFYTFSSGAQGVLLGLGFLGNLSPYFPGTFILGGGGPFKFIAKIGTTPIGDGLGPNGYGRDLTALEIEIISQIIDKMKPAHTEQVLLRTGLPPATRATIEDTGAGTVEITCLGITEATTVTLWEREVPGASEFNGLAVATVAGVKTAYTPPGVRYWVGEGMNVDITNPGLISNEVTNALTEPVLSATAEVRNIKLTWPAVTGATSYRIYRSTTSVASPAQADNAGDPIQVYADVLEYDDKMESGDSFFYRITPVVDRSEGFFSNEVSATAL